MDYCVNQISLTTVETNWVLFCRMLCITTARTTAITLGNLFRPSTLFIAIV